MLIWAEGQKLRRSKIVWITMFAVIMVAAIVFAQGQFTFYGSRYINGMAKKTPIPSSRYILKNPKTIPADNS